jgi:cytidylate kinase
MIISLRGTNGSGKTTVVNELMRAATRVAPRYGLLGVRRPEAYCLTFSTSSPLYVLGPYCTPSACGFDGVTSYENQPALVRKYAAQGHVVFEGLLSGKMWGQVGALLEELVPQHGAALLYLTTPLDECIRRVVERRRQAGDDREFSEANLRRAFVDVRRSMGMVRRKHIKGLVIEEVSSGEAAHRCLELVGTR